jgi:hypothetical protein
MNEEIQKLKIQVEELKRWKLEKEKQQIVFPLDTESTKILQKDLIVATGNEVPIVITDLLAFGLEVELNGFKRALYASLPLKVFTVVAATNICTYTGGAHGLTNGDTVALASTGTLPAGLDSITEYFIISATSSTFKLSLTSGGSEIDITDTGTGTHYFGNI